MLRMISTKKKVQDLNSKLPATGIDPLQTLRSALTRWGPKKDANKILKLQPVGIDNTLKLIRKMGNSKSFWL